MVARIEHHDRNLRRQLRRAGTSTALNLAEVARSDAGNWRARLHTALGSVREVRAALEVAVGWGYLEQSEVAEADRQLNRIAAEMDRMIGR